MNYSIFTRAPDSGIPQECFPIDEDSVLIVVPVKADTLYLETGELHTFEHNTFYGRIAFYNEWFALTGKTCAGMKQS